jgi:hypothetical protein
MPLRHDIAIMKTMSVRKIVIANVPRIITTRVRRNRPVWGREASVKLGCVFIGLVAFRATGPLVLLRNETTAVVTSLYRQNHANKGKPDLTGEKSRRTAY